MNEQQLRQLENMTDLSNYETLEDCLNYMFKPLPKEPLTPKLLDVMSVINMVEIEQLRYFFNA